MPGLLFRCRLHLMPGSRLSPDLSESLVSPLLPNQSLSDFLSYIFVSYFSLFSCTYIAGYTRYTLFFFFACIPSCPVTRDIRFSSFSRVYYSARLHALYAFLLFRVYTLHPGYTRYSQYTQYICNTRNTPDTRNTRNICSSTSHKSCR